MMKANLSFLLCFKVCNLFKLSDGLGGVKYSQIGLGEE